MSESLLPEVERLALRLYEGLNCPRSLTAAILLRYGEWDALSKLKAAPSDYDDPDDFYRAYQACEFLRKYPGLPLGVDTSAVAWNAWLESEASCYQSNERLSPYLEGVSHPECDERIIGIFREIRKEVTDLIGARPPVEIDGCFGPGATVSDPAIRCTITDKLSSSVSFTPDAVYWLVPWSGTAWAKAVCEDRQHQCLTDSRFRPSRGNVWFSVPKDATTDRSCAKEPSLNSFYQRGLGIAIAARLKQRGIDLKTRPDLHKELAQRASATGEMATIDIKSASDTICINLVRLLLPSAWFEALDSLRSKFTLRPSGGWQRLEKFSSMGNGFTFELETLLYLAICRAASRHAGEGLEESVTVFGDDIIARTEAVPNVLALLQFCGFTPNKRKTYVDGRFRESCGGDFFDGQAVRPYLLKDIPNEPQFFIGIANGLRRVERNFGCAPGRGSPVHRAWLYCVDALPKSVRDCRGPESLGDLLIHTDEAEWRATKQWHYGRGRDGALGHYRVRSSIRYFKVYRPVSRPTVRWGGFGAGAQMAAALYLAGSTVGVSSRMFLNEAGRYSERDAVTGYKIGWTAWS